MRVIPRPDNSAIGVGMDHYPTAANHTDMPRRIAGMKQDGVAGLGIGDRPPVLFRDFCFSHVTAKAWNIVADAALDLEQQAHTVICVGSAGAITERLA